MSDPSLSSSATTPSSSSSAIAERGPVGYSLWFIPDDTSSSIYRQHITDLQAQYNPSIQFEPHITLLGDIFPSASVTQTHVEERTEAVLRTVLPSLRSFTVPLREVSNGHLFYRCVYLLCEHETTIMQLNTAIQKVFGHQETYMPHLSLLYADISTDQRETIRNELQTKFFGPSSSRSPPSSESSVRIKAIELWDTTGRPPVWKRLKVWSLQE